MQKDAMQAAACIGCGACVASCKNAAAMLFVSAKVTQMANLPQGQTERSKRVLNMVAAMDAEKFGNCSNTGECEAACPAGIKLTNMSQMNREYMKALLFSTE
jgi:succinate dehydrogenase / fumarate reductase iron-sulfur subunit